MKTRNSAVERLDDQQQDEAIPLHSAVSHLLEECRMVLPGIQALFGFQLIAVFQDGFTEELSSLEQRLHFASIILVIVAIIVVMAPAALHRQVEPHSVSRRFIQVTSRLLLWSMLPLAIGIGLEVYLVGRVVLNDTPIAIGFAAGVLGLFILLWLVMPLRERARRER